MGWPNSGSHVVLLLWFLCALLSSNLDLIQKVNVGQERECPTPAVDIAPPSPHVKWPNHLNLRTEASGGQ